MALPQNVIDGRAALIAAKAQIDIAVSKAATEASSAKTAATSGIAGGVKWYVNAYTAWSRLKELREAMNSVHGEISIGLLEIYGVADVGPIVLAPGR